MPGVGEPRPKLQRGRAPRDATTASTDRSAMRCVRRRVPEAAEGSAATSQGAGRVAAKAGRGRSGADTRGRFWEGQQESAPKRRDFEGVAGQLRAFGRHIGADGRRDDQERAGR